MSLCVCLTVDLEQDCPPFLDTYRGMAEGLPVLLELLREEDVRATFFCTGEAAKRFPDSLKELVADGHELGCHGMTHRKFSQLDRMEAQAEIAEATALLRQFAPVESFRAPNLSFPDSYLPLLEDAGYAIDSSQAAYKPATWVAAAAATKLTRVRASIPPSVLRLPRAIRDPWLASLASPVVLFVHPWEFVDFRRAPLPLDCRFGTGDAALTSLAEVLRFFRERDAAFCTIRTVRQ